MKKERLNQNQIVKLLAMSANEAFKILEIDPSKDYDLKKAYRKASSKHHPDKGGDLETMKQVNEAYELLKKEGKVKRTIKDFKEEHMKSWDKNYTIIKDLMKKIFFPKAYLSYFKKFTDVPLTFSKKVERPYPSKMNIVYEFHTKNRDTVFYVGINISLHNVDFTHTLGGGEVNVDFDYESDNYLYHNKRKHKMKRTNWQFRSSTGDVIDPKKMFPAATLKKVFTEPKPDKEGKTKIKKFTKKDFETGLARQLGAKGEKVSLFDEYYIEVSRYKTPKKSAEWLSSDIYGKDFKSVTNFQNVFMPETANALKFLVEYVEKIRKAKDLKKATKIYKDFGEKIMKYKQFRITKARGLI